MNSRGLKPTKTMSIKHAVKILDKRGILKAEDRELNKASKQSKLVHLAVETLRGTV